MNPEKRRRADPDLQTAARQSLRKAEPGAGGPARREERDARGDHGRLKENQARLGVGPDHKTRSMKKGRRGTFP